MPSYTVEWTRPTMILDQAGQARDGFQVRIILYPWNEARDLKVYDIDEKTIKKAAETAVKARAALDKLTDVEVKLT